MADNKKGLFFVFAVILFILNMEFLKLVFSLKGEFFLFELLLFIFLGLMALDSMNEFTKKNSSCFSVLAVYFAINMMNSSGISLFSDTGLNISMIIFAGLGFIISLFNIKPKTKTEEFPEDMGALEKPEIEVAEDLNTSNLGGGAIMTEYYPGKYLASKTGKKYHSPKCDFAKKIPKRNHVWFNNKTEARKKGYGPCKCI